MVERALVVVQAEQQRADVRARAVLVPAEAGDDAVGGALVLDLEHRALARLVRRVEPLGDRRRRGRRPRTGRTSRRRARGRASPASGGSAARRAPRTASSRARRSPCGAARRSSSPSASRSQATKDAGVSSASIAHARRGRVDAQQQRLEVERRRRAAITISPSRTQRSGQRGPERLGQLGEVAVERLEVAALDVDLVAVAEDERAEAVPLRLEQPAVAGRQAVGRLGEHRLERGLEGQAHRLRG